MKQVNMENLLGEMVPEVVQLEFQSSPKNWAKGILDI